MTIRFDLRAPVLALAAAIFAAADSSLSDAAAFQRAEKFLALSESGAWRDLKAEATKEPQAVAPAVPPSVAPAPVPKSAPMPYRPINRKGR